MHPIAIAVLASLLRYLDDPRDAKMVRGAGLFVVFFSLRCDPETMLA
jgi:hypothetical protein